MRRRFLPVALLALVSFGCGGARTGGGGGQGPCSPATCFMTEPGCYYLGHDGIFVANAGSNSISAFQASGPNIPVFPICGSPFAVSATPTALARGSADPSNAIFDLIVLSGPQRTISLFTVDSIADTIKGLVATSATIYTPVAAVVWRDYFYAANAEGNVSGYQVSGNEAAPTITEVPGSPFPAGSGPVAIAAYPFGPFLYVANSQSNDVSAYSIDPATGALTPVPGSPFPTGSDPGSIDAAPLSLESNGAAVVAVANAGSNDVSVFSIASDGSLAPVLGSPFAAGTAPSSVVANYNLYPVPFVFVANSGSNDVTVFKIDDATGVLTPTAGSPFSSGGKDPVSIAVGGTEFIGFGSPPEAPFVYVVNAGSNNMSVFSLATGALSPVQGSPFKVGQSPRAVVYWTSPGP